MRKIILYSAVSLNFKIADNDGKVDWLESIPNPDKLDYGYNEFIASVDTTIQGGSTYRQLIDWKIDFPYSTSHNYVVTNKRDMPVIGNVEFISNNHLKFIQDLKNKAGKNIWLIGGSQVNTSLLNAGLINELIIFIMPILLNGGIPLFYNISHIKKLRLKDTKTYDTGVQELRYEVQ